MGTRRAPSAPRWQVILEEIRSQNRSTLEAVEAFRQSIEERIDRLDRDSRDRDGVLALALVDLRQEVRQQRQAGDIAELKELSQRHGHDVRELKVTVQENTVELRNLSLRVDALNRLEERVAALERRA